MLETLLHTLQRDKLFPPEQWVILAVSGGADSLALLHACVQLREQLSLKLHVATINHGLRGADGAADVAFVQDMARKLNIACSTGKADVYRLAEERQLGIEAAARQARYAFLADVARQVGAMTIATAHHADDQVETVLMHILRGSGLQGVLGMPVVGPVPNHPDFQLVRPLLSVTHSEIESYCAEHRLNPREDLTNQDTRYQRNAIRHDLLPALRQYNPQVDVALLRLRDIAATESAFVDRYFGRDVLPQMVFGDGVSIGLATFQNWHPALQRRALRSAAQHLGAQPSHEQTVAAQAAIERGVGALSDLTNGVQLRIGYDTIFIERSSVPIIAKRYYQIPPDPIEVQIPGITRADRLHIEAIREPMANSDACLNIKPETRVILRTRRAGDRIQPLGLRGHSQKIKKWLIDHKVPQSVRDRLPLLIINGYVAAILFSDTWVVSESYMKTSTSQHLVHFSTRYDWD